MAFFGESYRIFNLINIDEYKILNAQQKETLHIILSVSMVDLDVGAPMRNILWEMFPVGTITGDAFRNPVNGLIELPPTPEVP